ncbi:ImmA/IrrE family metallo-endopeptidase [Flavobacterium arcticum]|uniref:ImmA/IrrE family metallo-endopeptidase n=1 Tax=Flavobacterium arcticum TaxID=1784713 RepID=A0A345HF62_9FLAO|nr:ImmA/IrrE family metallo-endopeptidase [Flavobacterium arcticum]AXG75222.1 ImmA/IrrE family metallo-endopeptidase [Flavobacterium arcticum]KAF2513310.1 ImmA/IrrE family metallo-endopeptidase [Flavobacterium arcticum]
MATINQYYPESVTHPGDILLEALEERELGAKEFAVRTGKPEKTITAVLKGESAITPDMAVLFEQVLKIPAHFWMNAQSNFDEYQARVNFQLAIDDAIEWAKKFPYAKMASMGWLPKTLKIREKVVYLFNYFEVASTKAWEDYYINQKLQVAFRISLKDHENATAIASWLRQGELQSELLEAPEFDKSAFKKLLPEIKKIMAKQPDDFFEQLQALCLTAGVKVVHTPCLPKTAIHGSTRWINNVPLIQLSGRYRRNDIFWFTFFHEVGHILLHGKKYISIENVAYAGENEDYEAQADAFASNIILSEKEEAEICSNRQLSTDDIVRYAKKFGTHPASIIGRLQYKEVIAYGQGNEFFKPINFCD